MAVVFLSVSYDTWVSASEVDGDVEDPPSTDRPWKVRSPEYKQRRNLNIFNPKWVWVFKKGKTIAAVVIYFLLKYFIFISKRHIQGALTVATASAIQQHLVLYDILTRAFKITVSCLL